ncbi:putative membrane protein [Emiliania huxleyi virus 164]|nr:putative membrane protein [Emiliania huxleyi virus 164]
MLALTVCIATSFIGSTRYMHTTHTTHMRPYAFVPDLFEASSLSVLHKDMSDVYLPTITGLTHIFNFYAIFYYLIYTLFHSTRIMVYFPHQRRRFGHITCFSH